MPTTTNCPNCQRKLRVPDQLIGASVKCPNCRNTFTASASDSVFSAETAITAPARANTVTRPAAPSAAGWDETPARTNWGDLEPQGIGDERYVGRRSSIEPLAGEGPSLAAMVLLGMSILSALAALGVGWHQYGVLGRLAAGQHVPEAEVDTSELLVGASALAQVGLTLLTAVLFCTWFYQAYKNLMRMGMAALQFSPGWAAGGFFVPILNLFRPCQVAQEIWRASDPEVSLDHPSAWRKSSGSYVIGLWWTCWLGMNITASIAAMANDGDARSLQGGVAMNMVSDGISIVAALLAILMIWQIQQRQKERHNRLLSEPE